MRIIGHGIDAVKIADITEDGAANESFGCPVRLTLYE
jgi:hypothetical protein